MLAATAASQHALARGQALVATALPDGQDGHTHSLQKGSFYRPVQFISVQRSLGGGEHMQGT